MASPTAVPMMPDSASGVSMTRSSPKSFCSPSVILNTAPSLPTSSPIMMTFSSASIALRRPSLSALAIVIAVPGALISGLPGQCAAMPPERFRGVISCRDRRDEVDEFGPLVDQFFRHRHVHVLEDRFRRRVRQLAAAGAHVLGERAGLLLDLVEEVGRDLRLPGQVCADPFDRVFQLPGLRLAAELIPTRVVVGGVRIHPVGEYLDERGTLGRPGVVERLPGDRERGEDVVAVDPDPGEPEAVGALVERHPALPLDRFADRPLIVLAEE